jgi:hypothetical protein
MRSSKLGRAVTGTADSGGAAISGVGCMDISGCSDGIGSSLVLTIGSAALTSPGSSGASGVAVSAAATVGFASRDAASSALSRARRIFTSLRAFRAKKNAMRATTSAMKSKSNICVGPQSSSSFVPQ